MSTMITAILFDPRLTPAAAGLLGALIGVTGTLLVTIVNGLIGRNRFQREKIWERRQQACNEIVGAMRAALPAANRIEAGFQEDSHGYYSSKALEKEHAAYWEIIEQADDTFKQNYLILPVAFRNRYERLSNARHQWDYDAGPDVYMGPIDENSAATSELMDIALYSLGIVPWWHHAAIRIRLVGRRVGEARRTSVQAVKRKWKRLRRRNHDDDFDF